MSNDEPIFPVHLLKPHGGSLHAMLWTNDDHPLGLYWECTIAFEDVPYGESTEGTAMTVEDFDPKVRHWRDLVGYRVVATEEDSRPQGAFYLMDHRPAERLEFEIRSVDGALFTIRMKMRVDLNDRYDLEDPPLDDIDVVAQVPFEELVVDRRVVPKKTVENAIEVLAPFIDPASVEYTNFDGNFWRFKPKL